MASVRILKKNINHVLGDILGAVYIHEMTISEFPSAEAEKLIDDIFVKYDELITKVNAKKGNVKKEDFKNVAEYKKRNFKLKVENKKAHYKQIYAELEESAGQLIEKLNAL